MSKGKRRKCCCLLHEEIIHCHPQPSMILSYLAASCMSMNWSQTYMLSQRGWWVISVMRKLFLCLFQSILSFILYVYRQSSRTCKLLWNISIGAFVIGKQNWSCSLLNTVDNLIEANWVAHGVAAEVPGFSVNSLTSCSLQAYLEVIIGKIRPAISAGKRQCGEKMIADATWHFSNDSLSNTTPPNLVNVLPQLCSVKRTGPGVPVLPLMISVLLLLWTLAACRGLWRGRYVDLLSFPLTWFLCVFLFVSLLSGGSGRLPCVSFKSRAEAELRNAAPWLQTPCSSLLLLFFFLHECALPADEGDQDGSLYFLPSRCRFACISLPFYVFSVRVP